jgi:hypothetical protein
MAKKRREPDLPDPSPVPPEDEVHDATGDLEQSTPSPPTPDPPTSFEADQPPVHEEEPPTLDLPPPNLNQSPVPPVITPQAPPMADVKTVAAPQYNPVAVGTRKIQRPPVQVRMINDRASHFYFRRTLSILRSLGKYR